MSTNPIETPVIHESPGSMSPPGATADLLARIGAMSFTAISEVDAHDGTGTGTPLRIIGLVPGERRRLRLLTDALVDFLQHDLKLDSIDKPVACLHFTGSCPLCKISNPALVRLIPAYDLGRRSAWLLRGTARTTILPEKGVQVVLKTGSLLDQLRKLALPATADVVLGKRDPYSFTVVTATTDPAMEPPESDITALRRRAIEGKNDILADHVLIMDRERILANPEIARLIGASTL